MRFLLFGLPALNPGTSVPADPDRRSVGRAMSDPSGLGAPATEFRSPYLGVPATATSYVTETPTRRI